MIISDESSLKIRGTLAEVETDLTLILRKVRKEILVPALGDEKAEEEMNKIIELSKKSDDEIIEEAKATVHAVFEDIFKGAFAGMR